MTKQILKTVFIFIISVILFPLSVSAATSGECGENLTWTLSDDGVLTISGTGAMSDYIQSLGFPWEDVYVRAPSAPWTDYADEITKIIIADGVTHIGECAFYNCGDISTIQIPASVTSIGDFAFYFCDILTGVYITDLTAWCNINFNNESSNPLFCAGNLYINNELATNIVIPDNVTSISDYAFYNCKSMTDIIIPASVTSIGRHTFHNTTYYENSDNWENDVFYIGDYLLYAKNTVSGECKIREGTRIISNNAFYNCDDMTSVIIPDSITDIGKDAFYGSGNITGVYITDITAWCNITFNNSYSNPLHYAKKLYINNKSVLNITIPDGITTIKDYTFYNCSNLLFVTIPESVTSIGESAFHGCSSLTKITIPGNVATIGDSAFYECSGLKELNILNGVTSIDSYAFAFCSQLTSVTIPDSVTSIGSNAFRLCKKLTNITIPDSVTSIGSYAFYMCNSLESIIIPDKVTSIGDYTFCDCTGLTDITLPDNIVSIGDLAFYNCSSLKSIDLPDCISINRYSFAGCDKLIIYCMENSTAHTYALENKIAYSLVNDCKLSVDLVSDTQKNTVEYIISLTNYKTTSVTTQIICVLYNNDEMVGVCIVDGLQTINVGDTAEVCANIDYSGEYDEIKVFTLDSMQTLKPTYDVFCQEV